MLLQINLYGQPFHLLVYLILATVNRNGVDLFIYVFIAETLWQFLNPVKISKGLKNRETPHLP